MENVTHSQTEKQGVFSPTLEVPTSGLRVYDAGELARTPLPDPSPPTRPTRLRSLITQSQPKPAAQVGFFNVEWHQLGNPDELLVLPVCSSCGLVISDLNMGIAVVDFPVEESFEPAGEIDGRPLSKVPGQLFFFHKGSCDRIHGLYNIELDKIFKTDQRYDSQTQEENEDE